MKLILMIGLMIFSSFSLACSELSGTYDLPSMTAQCSSDRPYIPGDSSPLYTIFPSYTSSFPRGEEGTVGYVEPNTSLKITTSKDCKSLTISYFTKNSILRAENAIHDMIFNVTQFKNGVLSVSSKEKTPYSCEMGLCGKMTETKILSLQKISGVLYLNSVVRTKGIIYMIPFSKVEYPLTCQFRKD